MLRALALSLTLLCACQASSGRAQSADTTELTIEQARQLAVYALQTGSPGMAIEVSKELLRADPHDSLAYYVIAKAHAGLNQPNLARRAATFAYRYSKTSPAHYQAAQLAAQMAYTEGKPTLAQYWLRRTAIHAPTERQMQLVARDFQALRRQNPWSYQLRTSLRPSSNVNSGSDTALQLIDGEPDGGSIPLSGQALSGLIGSLDLSTSYRLKADATSATTLGARLYMQRVALSSSAKAQLSSGPAIPGQAPVRNSNFASTYAELSLRHAFAVGDKKKGGSASAEVALGEAWYAQERSFRFSRLSLERKWMFDEGRTRLVLNAVGESRSKARYRSNHAQVLGLGGEIHRRLSNGDKLDVSLALRDTAAKTRNGTFTSASMRTSYTFAKPIGPVRLSAGLLFGYSEYPNFKFSLFKPASSRDDKSVYGDLNLFFYQYDYAGFAPLLRIRTGRKISNYSRFSSRELSVSLSIQSSF